MAIYPQSIEKNPTDRCVVDDERLKKALTSYLENKTGDKLLDDIALDRLERQLIQDGIITAAPDVEKILKNNPCFHDMTGVKLYDDQGKIFAVIGDDNTLDNSYSANNDMLTVRVNGRTYVGRSDSDVKNAAIEAKFDTYGISCPPLGMVTDKEHAEALSIIYSGTPDYAERLTLQISKAEESPIAGIVNPAASRFGNVGNIKLAAANEEIYEIAETINASVTASNVLAAPIATPKVASFAAGKARLGK